MDADPLQAVFARLLPLVRDNLDWWRDAVRRWASNPPLHRDLPSERDEDDDHCNLAWLPVPFPDDKPLTTDEWTALLAAIHDSVAIGVSRAEPWLDWDQLQDQFSEGSRDEYWRATRYQMLLGDRVPALRENWDAAVAAKIEAAVQDVERELAQRSNNGVSGMESMARRPTINARMYDTLSKKPEANGWSSQQWADHLGCSKSSVAETPCWQTLKVVKADRKIDKLGLAKRRK